MYTIYFQNLHPSITNYAHNVPKSWENKPKKGFKTSKIIRFLADLMPENEAKRIYIQVSEFVTIKDEEILFPLAWSAT